MADKAMSRAGRSARGDSSGASRAKIDELSAKLAAALADLEMKENPIEDDDEMTADEKRAEMERELASVVDRRVETLRRDMEEELEQCAADLKARIKEVLHPKPIVQRRRQFFHEKEFKHRNSILSLMLSQPHFQSIYHIFLAILVWLGVNIILQEWFTNGRLLDTEMALFAFRKYDLVIPFWFGMQAASILIVPFVQAIHLYRLPVKLWMPVYLVLQFGMLTIPSWFTLHHELPPASALVVMCEMARFFMKTHAYLRDKVLWGLREPSKAKPAGTDKAGAPSSPRKARASRPPRVFAAYADFIPAKLAAAGMTTADLNQPDTEIGDLQTEVGRYLYFVFAPTLVYRDRYPRSGGQIRWLHAAVHLLNLVGVMVYVYLIFGTFCVPSFRHTGRNPGDFQTFILSVMSAMLPGMGVLVFMFFGVLHSWFNLWAEVLRFGDRQFYQDWWNSKSFASYYRRWNGVVHEWLFAYLYMDSIRFSLGRLDRTAAMALVFVISALIHEQIIACAMGFWYPVLLLMFGGPGVFFVTLTKRNTRYFNVFLWLMLSIGTGLLLVLYSREYYARADVGGVVYPGMESGYLYFVPRSWLAFYQDRYITHVSA